MALEKGLLKRTCFSRTESLCKLQLIGQGIWRHLAFENGFLRNGLVSSNDKEDYGLENIIKPKLSLQFSLQCLLKAFLLLANSESKNNKSGSLKKSSTKENDFDASESKNLGHKNLGNND